MDLISRTESVSKKSFLFFLVLISCFFFSKNVNAQTDRTVDNGTPTKPITFPVTGCTYTWINTEPSIGLPASGTGDIASFIAVNKGNAPINAKIIAAPMPLPPHTYGIGKDGYVSVLDPSNNNLQIGTIQIPYGLLQAVSPDGNLLYFLSTQDQYYLYVASAVSYEVLGKVPVPFSYPQYKLSADGSKMYAIGNAPPTGSGQPPQQLITINTATRQIVSTLTLSGSSYYLPTVRAELDKLFLLDQADGNVTIVDTKTNTVSKILPIIKPEYLVFGPGAAHAYITGLGSNLLNIIDTKTDALTTVDLGAQPNLIRMSEDGRKLYFTTISPGNRVIIVDTASGKVLTVPMDAAPGTISLSPDGNKAYVFAEDGKIVAIDGTRGQIIKTIQLYNGSADQGYYRGNSSMTIDASGDLYVSYTLLNYFFYENKQYLAIINTDLDQLIDVKEGGKAPPQAQTTGPCSGPPFTINLTVNPPPPAVFSAGTVAKQNSIYGMPSGGGEINVSGTNIATGILVTPPAGFEVSTDGLTYSKTLTIIGTGTIAPTPVYVRLSATAAAGLHPGDIVLSSGAALVNVTIAGGEVMPAPLTITANKLTKMYGAALTDGPGLTGFTADGLMNNETIGSLTVSYGPSAAATANVGVYPQDISLSDPVGGTFVLNNYAISNYIKGNIVVTPAPLTITAEDKTRFFGEPDPILTARYNGFVNNEDAGVLSILPKFNTTITSMSIVGKYPITVYGAVAVNYTINYVPGVFTIAEQPITVANAFTPNGDGVNDTWEIKYINQYPDTMVEIFSRYGNKVFYEKGYTLAFNGSYNGTQLAMGTYYYIIHLGKDIKPLSGYLTIIR